MIASDTAAIAAAPLAAKPGTSKPRRADVPRRHNPAPGVNAAKKPVASGSIVIEAGVLAKAMHHAASVVERRNTIPIAANVRLCAEGDELEIVATDFEVEFRQRLPLTQGGALATTVGAQKLAALAGALNASALMTLALDDGRLTVKSGHSRWQLPVLPANDFPLLPFEDEGAARLAIEPASAFATSIARVLWAVHTGLARYYLNGPLLHAEDGKAVLAATDGNVLVRVPLGAAHPKAAPDAILGPKFCRVLQALTADTAGELSLAWNETKVRAALGAVMLTGKLIEGKFPDYRRAIPREGNVVIADPAHLRGAVRRVMLVGSEKTRIVKLHRGEGKIVLSIATPEGGSSRDEVSAESEAGPTKGFNGVYLDKMLEAIGGETIEIHQADDSDFALMRRVVSDGALGVIGSHRI